MTESLKKVAQEVKTIMESEGRSDFLKVTHAALDNHGFPEMQRGMLIHQVAALMPFVQ